MSEICVVHSLGQTPYDQAWQLQNRLAAEIGAGTRPATLLLLEHPHTYTFGRSGHAENLLWDEAELARREISVHWTDRGGDVTYHGPGQLVGYPLLPLGSAKMQVDPVTGSARLPQVDYVGYVRKLEHMLLHALASLGITGMQLPGLTGVWVQPAVANRNSGSKAQASRPAAKIAAIGVKVDARGVSRHGFALNVNPEMAYWEGIIGCGLKDHPVASLAELLDPAPGMEAAIQAVKTAFGEIFDYQPVEADIHTPAQVLHDSV